MTDVDHMASEAALKLAGWKDRVIMYYVVPRPPEGTTEWPVLDFSRINCIRVLTHGGEMKEEVWCWDGVPKVRFFPLQQSAYYGTEIDHRMSCTWEQKYEIIQPT